jgi:hypothetical protein
MAKDEKKTITINDIKYDVEDLSEQQLAMVNHIADLDRKMSSARFNLDQLQVGRTAFHDMLVKSLEAKDEEAA